MTDLGPRGGDVPGPSIRVGILLDGLVQPSWVWSSLEGLLRANVADVVYVRISGDKEVRGEYGGLEGNLWYRFYSWMDGKKSIASPDPLEPVSVEPLLSGWDVPVQEGEKRPPVEEEVDLELRLGEGGDVEVVPEWTRLGLCYFRFGSADEPPGPPGFWPVLMNRPTTTVDLVLAKGGRENVRVLRATCRTDRFSVRANRAHLLWRAASLVVKLLKNLSMEQDDGSEGGVPSPRTRLREPRLGALPLLRLFVRWVRIGLRERMTDERVSLAYETECRTAEMPPIPEISTFKILASPPGYSWADPFPVAWKGRRFIFFEELVQGSRKGRISVLELGPEGAVSDPIPVLERPYHLSYPFLLEHGGELFMIPETANEKKIELYRCVEFPGRWVREKVLLDGVSGVDPTLLRAEGRWWLFTNLQAPGTGHWDEDLHIFMADDLLGPWFEHPANPVKSDVRGARPAGAFFRADGRLLRPAQDCSWRYGHGIRLYEVEELTETRYVERERGAIHPEAIRGFRGVHTLNRAGRLVVIDGFTRHFQWR